MAVVSSCGLPQVGPNKRQIFAGSVQRQGDSFIVAVNDRVTRATSVVPALGFSDSLKNAGRLGSDTIQPGDVLGLTIYENVDDPLLGVEGSPATQLEEVQVDGSGFIFIPYAGRIKASGNTPEAIRRIITAKLADQTPDPQVEVRRVAGDGSTVSLIGAVGGQGVYAIERPTRTLGAMLARAGGVTVAPEIAQITVIRGSTRGKIWLQDLYDHPELDIALRGGDRILIEEDTRAFTALGATGGQARVPFESQNMSALEAIARVGGLNPATADPTGIFVMRNEEPEIANSVLGRNDLQGAQRMVYVLDLTQPNGMFEARDFLIRDGDTLYVTEAPYTQFTKILSALTGPAGSVNSLSSLAGN
ncbi:polysaccharide biosynthesis/export family protein [Sulfitobacter pseudonitzschiae]|uniref:Polysaccharide biosynthesis/export family protein n=1 Tax=Pseudosulfitobacter pseudonitzschiae TaxID=1402135 RepID=A0A9Q2RZS6_9RHOB|nr:polysaccharide biosynthesis/export family protein [Pseudosulfitobacter pseudonitzschiae]MBM2291833.1 polysaccharide biosynthesis/export family protein [Pseudosulfitobacter pseudonitzschiae]MBM2296751.1 polysaccharide biosynthesis/export family protein [Pseudosulfitobacter pseudonitzschiae]MBM2301664.1 polysaccharide biosynthesis/export family protein [Pseudosulfitobacter pseudonitzschiae]MBM2311447.1 polysaccharide biosynthesis/export family protein [Pseudosulfitobacter pseudonitzschiae]MBM